MVDFDKTKPSGSESIRLGDDRVRENFDALEERLSIEHNFPDNAGGSRKGRHKFGVGTAAARNAAVGTPVSGMVWYNSSSLQWEVYDGTTWRGIGASVGDIKFTAHWSGASDLGGGWIRADGRVLSQATYAKLYSVCGSAFNTGGEGAGNFRIPDLRGRVPLGHYAGGDGDADYDTPGVVYGTKKHTLVVGEMPSHDHGGVTGNPTGANPTQLRLCSNNGTSGSTVVRGGDFLSLFESTPLVDHTHDLTAEGGGAAHENRQPSLTLVAHIYTGV